MVNAGWRCEVARCMPMTTHTLEMVSPAPQMIAPDDVAAHSHTTAQAVAAVTMALDDRRQSASRISFKMASASPRASMPGARGGAKAFGRVVRLDVVMVAVPDARRKRPSSATVV